MLNSKSRSIPTSLLPVLPDVLLSSLLLLSIDMFNDVGSGSTFSISCFCVAFVAFLLLNAAPIPPSTAPTPPVIIAAALLTAAEFNTIFLNSFPPAKDFAALTALSIWIFGEVYSALARSLTCFSSNVAAFSAIIPEPSLDGKIEKSMITLPDLILLISNRSLCMPRE